jgi:enoyl-CoA hydratase/carnithine racemase
MSAPVKAVKTGARLDVVIDRAEARNALSLETLRSLQEVFERFAQDADLGLAVLTGAGERAFAAGGDLKELADRRTAADGANLFDTGKAALDAVRRFPVPVIAALNGHAVGGGAELAMACDFRVAAGHAGLGFVQAELGLSTGFGGLADLQAVLGPRKAMGILLEARILLPEEALRLGLVDAIAGEGETLEARVARFAAPILSRTLPLIRATKRALLPGEEAWRAGIAGQERAHFIEAWVAEAHWVAAEARLSRKR